MRCKRNWQSFWRGNPIEGFSFTRGLIIVNIVLFVAMVLQGVLAGYGMSVLLSPDPYLLLHVGAQYWPLVISENEWWRCITYAYTHGGAIHLAFNMVVLYQIGPLIENEIGPARFFVLYTLAALVATTAGYFWHPLAPVVGASGSLFGLIGFAIAYYHRVGPAAHELRNLMFRWAIIALLFGLMVGADNAAHLGGLSCGVVVGWFLPLGVRGRQKLVPLFNLLAGLTLAATVISILILIVSWFLAVRGL